MGTRNGANLQNVKDLNPVKDTVSPNRIELSGLNATHGHMSAENLRLTDGDHVSPLPLDVGTYSGSPKHINRFP